MNLLPRIIPSQQQVEAVLAKSGALRDGHFELLTGRHTDRYLQMPLAMRHYSDAKMLSVGLSRKLRADVEIAKHLPRVSIVCPATGGLPVAYGVAEALQAEQVYWAERQVDGSMMLRQFMEVHDHERIILVDDILRSGKMLREMLKLFADKKAEVLALGVLVTQPNPEMLDLGGLPVYSLAEITPRYFSGSDTCELCERNLPLEKLWL